ncbi:YolD-like family protein [Planococcus sp. ISL-109]|uniref:YolD-like family protein n=1 Tax=Planococcus sp. ISL-109 TaxID=2819166 RepID=UPI001BE5AE36|nr:YolD-like family protein [Planococcus sp. ISL-109]MBT2582646.1 YolD-like family protein [Planococcus sp. ISL-109]
MKKNQRLTVKGNVLDRGQLKWGSLMLPEHVRMLREWEAADPSKERPHLDEEELKLLQEEIEIAFQRQCAVEIRYWNNRQAAIPGIITAIDISHGMLEVTSGNSSTRIAFSDLHGIRLLD